MRHVMLALLLGLVAGCGMFQNPAGSDLTVECQDKSSTSAGVRCGDDNSVAPAVPQ